MESIVTLDKSIGLLREENSQGLVELANKTEENTSSTESLHKTVGELLDEFRGSRLDRLEEKREERSRQGQQQDEGGQERVSGRNEEDDFNPSDLMLFGAGGIARNVLGVLAAIPVAATAFAGGFVEGWVKTLNVIGKSIRATIAGVTKVVMKPVELVVSAIKRLARPFSGLVKVFDAGVDGVRPILRNANGTFRSLSRMERLFFTLGKTFSGMVKAIRAVVSAVSRIPKLIGSLLRSVRSIGTFLSSLPKMIGGRVSRVGGGITKSINGFFGALRSVGSGISSLGSTITRGVKTAVSPITKTINGFFSAWRSVAGITTTLSKSTSAVTKPLGPISKAINGIKSAIQAFGGRLGGIFRLFGTLGRVIAFPVTIIMGIIDGFKGFMRGWEEQEGIFNKLIAGALGAVGGVLRGIIGIPLDLLKSAVGFIAEKMGFENFAETLESFSFADIIQGIFYSITNVVLSIKDKIVAIFDDIGEVGIFGALSNLGADILEGIKSMLRKVIPDQDSFLGGFVPEGVYEFLDAPPPERRNPEIVQSEQPSTTESNLTPEERENAEAKLQEIEERERQLNLSVRDNREEIMSDPAEIERIRREMRAISIARREIESQLGPVEGNNEDVRRMRPERPDFSQRQMARAQLESSERENRQVEQASSINAVDASQRVVNNNNNVSNNQTALINSNMPAVDNLDRTWGW